MSLGLQKTGRFFLFFILFASLFNKTLAVEYIAKNIAGPEIKVLLKPDKKDWLYKLGQPVVFTVSVTSNDTLLNNLPVYYEVGLEKMPPVKKGELNLNANKLEIAGGTLKMPGFLRCKVSVTVNGKEYTETATAAFEPEKIKPTAELPADFSSFWTKALAAVRQVPLQTELTPLKTRSTPAVDVYQVSYQYSQKGDRFYGILCVPKQEGKYPAIIRFPGAGVRPLAGDVKTAADGFITLDLNIHRVPVVQPSAYYDSLQKGPLSGYQFKGWVHPDSSYYKNVILGCVRAVDMIYALPQFNGKAIGAWGSSQGGALSIITTSLEPRINYLVALCPALSDISGYLHGRAGGWPHIFNQENSYAAQKQEVKKTIGYYDVVNFARNLKVPGFYSWGFNDETTPPTSFYSAYNSIAAPKQVFIIPEGVHKIYPEQRDKTYTWLMEKLKR